MFKAYKYRIYPNALQKEQLARHFGCARFIYNWALSKSKDYYEKEKKPFSRRMLQNELVALKKKDEYSWLKEVNSQSLLGALFHVEKAYRSFFKKKSNFPKFKKKHNRQSYECPQHVSIDTSLGCIHLPKIKGIKIKLHRYFSGKIKTVTISKTPSGKFFASICVENSSSLPKRQKVTEKSIIGIDLGLNHFAITSGGEKINNPKFLKRDLKRLGVVQKIRARKDYKNKSNNYSKQSIEVAKVHERIAFRRYDFIQKLTATLVAENQSATFAVENLHIKGMIRNKKLSRSIADSSWGTFLSVLEYKLLGYGKNLMVIDRFFASSKTCHICQKRKEKLPLSVRYWECSCGALHDRDINAAKSIRKKAIADSLGQSGCVKSSSIV